MNEYGQNLTYKSILQTISQLAAGDNPVRLTCPEDDKIRFEELINQLNELISAIAVARSNITSLLKGQLDQNNLQNENVFGKDLRDITSGLSYITKLIDSTVKGKQIQTEIPKELPDFFLETIKSLNLLFSTNKLLEIENQPISYLDPITNTPNRTLFEDRLNHAIIQARRRNLKVGLLYLYLERLRLSFDAFGDEFGNNLLRAAVQRLTLCIRESDTIARLGETEFCVILIDLQMTEHAASVANKMLTAFEEPFNIDGHDNTLSLCIGISMFPDDSDNCSDLLRNAGLALYHVKKQGISGCEYYGSQMNEAIQRRMSLEDRLRKAIKREELELYYQPKINISTGRITGFEALLRWHNKKGEMVVPNDFIPFAEETGLIIPIGDWVIQSACRQNKIWRDAGLPSVRIAVNISARQFRHGGFLNTLTDVLKETRLKPDSIDIEITESMLIEDIQKTVLMLAELKEMGFKISMDDFGTGYSSLNYLKKFPIDTLKIDKSFVQNCSSDPFDSVILSTIIAMAHNLNIRVVAEGVETSAQLELLRVFNCDEVQGFYFSRPIPADKAAEMLKEESLHLLNV
ncbi:MAG: bifunctional diguanylate cyclase/phosphodiesterase [Nitrospirae bacterium]|nr:bifunctional diguanylate cyclase/phosphodiesterase [Nitrospirota bacterium]MBF0541360.1 bifunctional diguanylate cyclase/phosphodiesterase [Nitrospirota bacterium]